MRKSNLTFGTPVPELLILQLLARGEMYGYALAQAIKTITESAISLRESVLYPALHSLEVKGLLRSRREQVAGRVRVYYTITRKGRKELELLRSQWRRMSIGIDLALGDDHG